MQNNLTDTIEKICQIQYPIEGVDMAKYDVNVYRQSAATAILTLLDRFMPKLKEGEKAVLDKEFNNSSVVLITRMGEVISTVTDGNAVWDTMTDRLSPIATTHPFEQLLNHLQNKKR